MGRKFCGQGFLLVSCYSLVKHVDIATGHEVNSRGAGNALEFAREFAREAAGGCLSKLDGVVLQWNYQLGNRMRSA